MSKLYFTLRYFVIFFFMVQGLTSQAQSLACNGGVNISMDENCMVIMSSAHILKGPDANADPLGFLITLKNPDGTKPDSILVSSDPGGPFIYGTEGEYIKFNEPGSFIVSIKRKSDGVRCWGDLKIEDKLPPYTEECPCAEDRSGIIPDSCMFSCATVNLFFENDALSGSAGLNPVFVDNCGNTGDVTFEDILTEDTICGNWIITRTWKSLVPDAHGQMALRDLNCTQKFLFKNPGVDSIQPPCKKVIVTCGIDTDPESLRNYFSDTTYFSNPNPDTALTKSYPTLRDKIPGIGTILRQIGQGLKPGTNDIFCKITASYTDSPIIPHCEDIGYKFVRTWHVIDWCSNETLEPFHQVIKVMDNEAPHFKVPDSIKISSTNPWTCAADIIVPAPDTMYDNCVDASRLNWIAYVQDGPNRIEANAGNGYKLEGLGQGTFIITYVVTDPCWNSSDRTALLVIKDLVKPVALSKRTIKVTFSTFKGECVAKVFPYNIDAGSFDACDDVLDYAIRRKGIGDFGDFVKFTEDDLNDVTPSGIPTGEVKVELRVTDDCGNFNIAWTSVILEDKNTSVTKLCGDKLISLDCTANKDAVIDLYAPRVILNGCEERDLEVEGIIRTEDLHELCNTGRMIVDYFIVGSQDTICTKTFIFGGLDDLEIIWPDPVITVSCDETDFGDVIINGGNCNKALSTEKLREFTVPAGLGYCKKIVREITVIDWCNYQPNEGDTIGIYRFTQSIKVQDLDRPVIECEDLEVSAGPDCGVGGLVVTASGSDSGLCLEELSWEAAVDLNKDDFFETPLVVVAGGGDNVSATIHDIVSAGTYRVRWRASDNCGNSEEVFCSVTVFDDKAPSPQCISTVSTATMNTNGSVTIWAGDFDPRSNSADNCGGTLTYSFSGDDPSVTSRTFTCDDIPDNISALIDLQVYVWDESGNRDFCNVTLRIDDNSDACPDSNSTASLVISGMITTSLGDRLESAQVQSISMVNNDAASQMTNIEGEFAFGNNELLSDYELSAHKSDDYLNGVSTLDILLIQRHILNLTRLEGPYKVIAADVNSDEAISAVDLVVLKSLLLGRIDELPGGASWKFVSSEQQFDDPLFPWPLQDSRYVSDIHNSMSGQDFIGVKLGDVNGNAIANSHLLSGARNAKEHVVTMENKYVPSGQSVQIEMDLSLDQVIEGVQMELILSDGTWTSVKNDGIHLLPHQYQIAGNRLIISWTALESIQKLEKLTLEFESAQAGKLSDLISLGSNQFSAEIYTGSELEVSDLLLGFTPEQKSEFTLYQNVPNPFNGETVISFQIARQGEVELAIFDMTGRQLFGQTGHYDAGRHELLIDRSILDEKGVLYYQLSYGNQVATRKMISIE